MNVSLSLRKWQAISGVWVRDEDEYTNGNGDDDMGFGIECIDSPYDKDNVF